MSIYRVRIKAFLLVLCMSFAMQTYAGFWDSSTGQLVQKYWKALTIVAVAGTVATALYSWFLGKKQVALREHDDVATSQPKSIIEEKKGLEHANLPPRIVEQQSASEVVSKQQVPLDEPIVSEKTQTLVAVVNVPETPSQSHEQASMIPQEVSQKESSVIAVTQPVEGSPVEKETQEEELVKLLQEIRAKPLSSPQEVSFVVPQAGQVEVDEPMISDDYIGAWTKLDNSLISKNSSLLPDKVLIAPVYKTTESNQAIISHNSVYLFYRPQNWYFKLVVRPLDGMTNNTDKYVSFNRLDRFFVYPQSKYGQCDLMTYPTIAAFLQAQLPNQKKEMHSLANLITGIKKGIAKTNSTYMDVLLSLEHPETPGLEVTALDSSIIYQVSRQRVVGAVGSDNFIGYTKYIFWPTHMQKILMQKKDFWKELCNATYKNSVLNEQKNKMQDFQWQEISEEYSIKQ